MKESAYVRNMLPSVKFSAQIQNLIINSAKSFVEKIRSDKEFGIEEFMQNFSLSTIEGIAIICLAEGLLRVPDKLVALELATDKLSAKKWRHYLGKSKSLKANLTSIGLYVSGLFADFSKIDNIIVDLFNKVGQPVFLLILKQAIKFLSTEFVFGTTIPDALKNIKNYPKYRFAFDLLGESSRTMLQANIYYEQYINAIDPIAKNYPKSDNQDLFSRPNLSVKLTALYPRVEFSKKEDIDNFLLPKLIELIKKIRDNNLTITFDAEEAKRQDIYLHVLTKLVSNSEFKDFHGIGFVVQAYQTRAYQILDQIISLAKTTKKVIPIRLVKGAYWDSEIKYAQENALESYPVFTKKEYTDVSYIACVKKMLDNQKYIFPQFATHNALSVATIIELAKDKRFEFQKLHGMGRVLHNELINQFDVRIYAPVGSLHDLLAYLMRRMLENGANACFVNQVNNHAISAEQLTSNLYNKTEELLNLNDSLPLPKNIYPNRDNAMGHDMGYKTNYDYILEKVGKFYNKVYDIGSIIDGQEIVNTKYAKEHFCPAKFAQKIASVSYATESEMINAIDNATNEFTKWSKLDVSDRANILRNIADLLEENKFELYALIIKEAGKTIHDAINEVIEAIDFCRYYAIQSEFHMTPKHMPSPTGESNVLTMHGRGVFLCISPWNFPLAIFVGQIVAALVSGNTVFAKPAEQASVIANLTVKLMHKAGVPVSALQLVIASGSNIGKYVVTNEKIVGVVFTGSTTTAKLINLTLAERKGAIIPFIAETGGQNAMIVDSSALLEQVTDDVLVSAFYSAGQRCSALRMLYVQEDIYDLLLKMIKEATELLKISDNSDFATDIGPVINKQSVEVLANHIEDMGKKGYKIIIHPQNASLQDGYFFYPHIIEVSSINDIPDEKFGPILHIAKYKATDLDKVIDEINNYGFGLTFGVHTRIEKKIEYIRSKIKAGNLYANRSIVGAKVESQPFGGENKSGTGFKAGGPHYLLKFMLERTTTINTAAIGGNIELLNMVG